MMRKKKYTQKEMQESIGHGYLAGHRDGARDLRFHYGNWMTPAARAEAQMAIDELEERVELTEIRDKIAQGVEELSEGKPAILIDEIVRYIRFGEYDQ